MPGLQSANISSKLIKALGGEIALGPYLMGMSLPVQIAPMTASANDLVTLAVLAQAARDAIRKAPERQPRFARPG
jgi:malate dehydrogenase (oxaloacetate-decarboxylating)(NADP+)